MSRHARFMLASAACALLAAWLTFGYTGRAEKRDGPRVDVVIAPDGLRPGKVIDDAVAARLVVTRIPQRFAPPDAVADPIDTVGARPLAPVAAGGYLTRSALSGGRDAAPSYKLRSGERALTIDAIVSPAGSMLAAGDRVDLFASGFGGDQRTVELIDAAQVLSVEEAAEGPQTRATIRLAQSQVAGVIRADVFARELRAVLHSAP